MALNISYQKWYSRYLQRDMEYKVYGHQGKPVLYFPNSCGRFFQFEDSGMLDTVRGFCEEGRMQLWACDGIDPETFFADHGDIDAKIRRHEQYDQYLRHELVPSIQQISRESNNGKEHKLLVTGCSMGAYHSTNFFFRHPEVFDTLIALSGVYSADYFFGNIMNSAIYLHSPLHYLRNLQDEKLLSEYRRSRLIFCCGQGAWEDRMVRDTRELEAVLKDKEIPAWFDFWGHDVNHDWPWWFRQMSYYLPMVL